MAFRTPLIRQNRRCRAIGENNSSENGVFFTIDRLWRSHGECRIKVAMMRLKTGEMLIVATSRIRIKTARPIYRSRWGIETLFSCLKTRGFGLEDTHMTDAHKLATLIGILAIAFCLAYKAGLWVARVKPPRHKSHGRLQRSLFALGLNAFRKAMVKMSEMEIRDYMMALFKPNNPRKPLIELVF